VSTPSGPWFATITASRRGQQVIDIAMGASIPMLAVVGIMVEDVPMGEAAVALAAAIVVGVALVFRWRAPLAVLAVAVTAVLATSIAGQHDAWLVVAVEIAISTVAVARARRTAVLAALGAATILFTLARTQVAGPVTEPAALILIVWTALALATGLAVRAQRAYVSELTDRARLADESREQLARNRVAEERIRIAREVHDIVAHHIAVISVHSALARKTGVRQPDVLDASLVHVQTAARTALDELGTVLKLLRTTDRAELGPAPGLDNLDDLMATVSATGLAVRRTTTGRRPEMDPACELAVYRIVQESLTNAAKHGGTAVDFQVTYEPTHVYLHVRNVRRVGTDRSIPAGAASGGHGLVGMRERAEACGGTFAAGHDVQGGFAVEATVPYRPVDRTAASVPAVDSPPTTPPDLHGSTR